MKLVLVLAVVVGGTIAALRATCIEFWRVPDDDPVATFSLLPNLAAGDLVVVWTRGAPVFADLVRCPVPEDPNKTAIGRILGDPMDHVAIDAAQVSVNGRGVTAAHACTTGRLSAVDPQTNDPVDLVCEVEEVGGNSYQRVREAAPLYKPAPVSADVPAGYVYLVSDNRRSHLDSREFGPVPKATCQKIVLRLWSVEGWLDSDHRMNLIH